MEVLNAYNIQYYYTVFVGWTGGLFYKTWRTDLQISGDHDPARQALPHERKSVMSFKGVFRKTPQIVAGY
jgi:hypothetical protein